MFLNKKMGTRTTKRLYGLYQEACKAKKDQKIPHWDELSELDQLAWEDACGKFLLVFNQTLWKTSVARTKGDREVANRAAFVNVDHFLSGLYTGIKHLEDNGLTVGKMNLHALLNISFNTFIRWMREVSVEKADEYKRLLLSYPKLDISVNSIQKTERTKYKNILDMNVKQVIARDRTID